MKFTVSKDALLSRMKVAKQVISSKNVLPALDNFLFEVNDSTLTLIASDNETTLSLRMELMDCDTDGRIAIDAKMLTDAMKEIPEQPLVFFIDTDTWGVNVKYRNGEFMMMGTDPVEFPSVANLDENAHTFTTSSDELLAGIKNVLFAVANDELRPVMNGIYFDVEGNKITLVASDGTMLARRSTELKTEAQRGAFILPKKPASVLGGVLAKQTDDVTVQSDARNIRFTVGNTTMVCRMIEGRYPNYNSVIPQDNPLHLTVSRQILISALKRVSVFASQANSLVKFQISMGGVMLSCMDVDFSTSSNEQIDGEYNGSNITIGFKSTLLLEILNNLSTPDVRLEFLDATRATLLKPVDSDSDITMLLMPMQINV